MAINTLLLAQARTPAFDRCAVVDRGAPGRNRRPPLCIARCRRSASATSGRTAGPLHRQGLHSLGGTFGRRRLRCGLRDAGPGTVAFLAASALGQLPSAARRANAAPTTSTNSPDRRIRPSAGRPRRKAEARAAHPINQGHRSGKGDARQAGHHEPAVHRSALWPHLGGEAMAA